MSLMAANEESDPSAILNGFWVTLIFLWSLSIFYSSLTADGLSPSCLRSSRSLRQLLFLNYFDDIAYCIEFGTAAIFELYCIVQAVILSIFAAFANKVIVNGFL